ncbi:MAG: NUDIX hydrolase [Candidatus Jorgensenbacteria bacterium]|nr:NUDIX hydrolase [Candidatus Jorgensenbacteria bacterium]
MAICDHKSVGMLIWDGDKLLLIERRKPPYGFAPPAGHIDDHGSFEDAARKEVEEEVGLNAKKITLLAEGRKENPCRREDGTWHYWKIFEVKTEGKVTASPSETKQYGWYTKEQIRKLAERTENYILGKISETEWQSSPGIEPVWKEWLSELKIL